MANEIKKYLDTTALSTLVDQIKSEDAKVLKSAKDYCDAKDKLFEAAGAGATAEANAKAYTDELANGAVKTNTEALATLNGTGEGSVAKAVADSAATLQGSIDGVDAKADQNAADIAAINDGTNGILAQAKNYADDQIEAVQGDVDDLAALVGKLPEGTTAKDVVDYVTIKTSGIATDSALEELNGQVAGLQSTVQTINGDYLKSSDKTELEGKITAASDAAGTAQETANTAKAAIDAFLKDADASEKAIDTLQEIQAQLDAGETSAANLLAEIDALKAIDNATQAELDAALATVNGNIDKKADQETVDGIDGRLAAVEAIDVATKAYADQAETDAVNAAKTYADGINDALVARLDDLEAIDHEHANKAELDLIASGDKAKWDAAAAIAHEHGNKGVIDGITAEKVAAWDAAEGNAKTFAQGLNDTMQGVVDGIGSRVGTLESTIADKADADDLAEAVADIAENAAAIQANTSAINSFTAITSAEVEALFA